MRFFFKYQDMPSSKLWRRAEARKALLGRRPQMLAQNTDSVPVIGLFNMPADRAPSAPVVGPVNVPAFRSQTAPDVGPVNVPVFRAAASPINVPANTTQYATNDDIFAKKKSSHIGHQGTHTCKRI